MKKVYSPGETREDRIIRAKNHHLHLRDRRANAAVRQAEYDKLSPLERLALLDYKLGFNAGAARERKRLNDRIGND